jgi:putative N-acetylmannosamine-6-phosphate epimerase
MRSNEFLSKTIILILEKTNSDEIIQYLKPLGFDVKKLSGYTTKVIVPANQRFKVIQDIQSILPGAEISSNNKIIKYDSATIKIKPAEAQGGGLEKEAGQIIALDAAIKERLKGKASILLTVGKRAVQAAGVTKVPGTAKADVAVVDSAGTEIAWISLKDGNSPKGFGQWGGVSNHARDPEVADFVEKLRAIVGTEMPRGQTYGKFITSINLKNAMVFGKNFQSGQSGPNNVDLVLQGHPVLEKTNDGYIIKGTHVWSNGNTPRDQYDPVMTVRFSPDRNDFGIRFARITVYPNAGRLWKSIDQEYEQVIKQQAKQPVSEPKSIQNMKKNMTQSEISMNQEPQPKTLKPSQQNNISI